MESFEGLDDELEKWKDKCKVSEVQEWKKEKEGWNEYHEFRKGIGKETRDKEKKCDL